mmetsp:Transcript_20242/g.32355  ORF Transcript_20242/g.32355 Transcript_20242/m.32355 type:complete len:246 (+) Transcript_20242:632-1369(+)
MRIQVRILSVLQRQSAQYLIGDWRAHVSLIAKQHLQMGRLKQEIGGRSTIRNVVQYLGGGIIKPFLGSIELFKHILNVEIIAIIVASCTLKASFLEHNLAIVGIILSTVHLKHPTRPMTRPPCLNHRAFQACIGRVWQHTRIDHHARWDTIRKRTAALILRRAPISCVGRKHITTASNAQIVALKIPIGRVISQRLFRIIFCNWLWSACRLHPRQCFQFTAKTARKHFRIAIRISGANSSTSVDS